MKIYKLRIVDRTGLPLTAEYHPDFETCFDAAMDWHRKRTQDRRYREGDSTYFIEHISVGKSRKSIATAMNKERIGQ